MKSWKLLKISVFAIVLFIIFSAMLLTYRYIKINTYHHYIYVLEHKADFVKDKYGKSYQLFKNDAIIVSLVSPYLDEKIGNTECALVTIPIKQADNKNKPYTVEVMNLWIVDRKNNQIIPNGLPSVYANGQYFSQEFQSVPIAFRQSITQTGSLDAFIFRHIFSRAYDIEFENFPPKVAIHCYAKIDINGKEIIINKQMDFVKRKKILLYKHKHNQL